MAEKWYCICEMSLATKSEKHLSLEAYTPYLSPTLHRQHYAVQCPWKSKFSHVQREISNWMQKLFVLVESLYILVGKLYMLMGKLYNWWKKCTIIMGKKTCARWEKLTNIIQYDWNLFVYWVTVWLCHPPCQHQSLLTHCFIFQSVFLYSTPSFNLSVSKFF